MLESVHWKAEVGAPLDVGTFASVATPSAMPTCADSIDIVSGLRAGKLKSLEVLLWIYLVNLEFEKFFIINHEKHRICFIFEIITQQPRRNR